MLALCGKSATGKNFLLNELINQGMKRVVTYTTRPMRDGEEDRVDYYFIPDWLFARLRLDNYFAETTKYHVANGSEWRYGSALCDYTNNNDSVIILNPDGVKQIREQNIPVVVVLLDASKEVRMQRLKQRGDDEDEVKRRLEADDKDFADIALIADYVFFTDTGVDVKELAEEVYQKYKASSDELSFDAMTGTKL